MEAQRLPEWEKDLIDDAIDKAERRLAAEAGVARHRAVQLAREQAYHRLARAIDRVERAGGRRRAGPGQLSFFPVDPTLFDR